MQLVSKVDDLRSRIIAAREEEGIIRDTMMNNEERMSIEIVLSLEKKLGQLDD